MITLNYEHIDDGHKTTLILLHGFLNDRQSMKTIGDRHTHHANIVYVDLPGFGRTKSTGIDYTMEDIIDALKAIVDALQETELYMLGYSMGGRVALGYACKYRETLNGLILESTSPGIESAAARQDRISVDETRAGEITADYTRFIETWENMGLFKSQHTLDAKRLHSQREERMCQLPEEVADSLRKYGTGIQPSYWHRLNHVTCPVLQLAGACDDKFITVNERMHALFPNAHFEIIQDAGHNIHLEAPEKFDIIVTEFIGGGF